MLVKPLSGQQYWISSNCDIVIEQSIRCVQVHRGDRKVKMGLEFILKYSILLCLISDSQKSEKKSDSEVSSFFVFVLASILFMQ